MSIRSFFYDTRSSPLSLISYIHQLSNRLIRSRRSRTIRQPIATPSLQPRPPSPELDSAAQQQPQSAMPQHRVQVAAAQALICRCRCGTSGGRTLCAGCAVSVMAGATPAMFFAGRGRRGGRRRRGRTGDDRTLIRFIPRALPCDRPLASNGNGVGG
ncbi:hypothetical protein L209DRAFT_511458 [Thermothelomyces heterothallicus CBS 203.75]